MCRLECSSKICACLFKLFAMVFMRNSELKFIPLGRSQNWPDHRSPISKFWEILFERPVALINRWGFQSDRLGHVFEFFRSSGHWTWPGDLTLGDLGYNFHSRCGKDAWKCGSAAAFNKFVITLRLVLFKRPPPARWGLMQIRHLFKNRYDTIWFESNECTMRSSKKAIWNPL